MFKKIGLALLIFALGASLASYSANVPVLKSYIEISFFKNEVLRLKQKFGFYDLNPEEKTEMVMEMYNNPASVPPISFALMADNILEKDTQLALLFYAFANLRTGIDTNMCNDENALNLLDSFVYLAPNTYKVAKTQISLYLDAAQRALQWDEDYERYPDYYWACNVNNNPFYKGKNNVHPDEEYKSIRTRIRDSVKTVIEFMSNEQNLNN